MRLGCCIPFSGSEDDLASIDALAGLGYRYVETPAECLKIEAAPEEYYAVRRVLRRASLVPEVLNRLLPPDLMVVGDDVDWSRVERYIALTMDRAEEIGVRCLVFCSGPARRVPEGYPLDEALQQIRYFLNMAADYAGAVVIAVEAMAPDATNALNSLTEAATLVRELGRAEVGLVADAHHLRATGEPWDTIVQAKELLSHAYIGDPAWLASDPGDSDLHKFVDCLEAAGYDGRISVAEPVCDLDRGARVAIEALGGLTKRKG